MTRGTDGPDRPRRGGRPTPFVRREPLGGDLGEETGHEDRAGTYRPAHYRQFVVHGARRPDEVPPHVFERPLADE